MPGNEYVLPIGVDAGKFINDVREVKQGIIDINNAAKHSNAAMAETFSKAAEAQNVVAKNTVETNKQFKQQSQLSQQLAAAYGALATAASKASDTAPIKKFAGEFQKLADLAAKTKTLSIEFDDADLLLFEALLQQTGGELAELTALLEVLRVKLQSVDPNTEEFEFLTQQLKTAEGIIAAYNGELDETVTKSKSLKSELRELKQELAKMEEAGLEGTEAFQKMAVRAGELEDQLGDTAARIKVLASDTKYLDATIEAVTAVTAGFGVAQGAIALFGDENKELAETLNKVQGAMLILNSLQQIQNLLQKQSALAVLTTRGARIQDTAAIGAQTVATSVLSSVTTTVTTVFKGLWATLAANPITAILAAGGALIAFLTSLKSSAEEAAIAQERLNNALNDQGNFNDEFVAGIKKAGSVREAELKKQGASEKTIRDEQVKNLQQQLDQYNKVIEDMAPKADAALDKLRGLDNNGENEELAKSLDKTIQIYKGLQKQRNEVETEIRIKSLDNETATNKELEEARKKAADKAKEDAKKRLQIEEAYAKALEDIRKQVRDINISLIEDERERLKAEARAKYEDQIKALNDLLKQQADNGKLTTALQKAADEERVALRKRLASDILAIDAEMYKEQAELLVRANEAINQVFQNQETIDIEAVNKAYEELKNQLNKNNLQLSKELEKLNLIPTLTPEQQAEFKKLQEAIDKNNNIIFDLNKAQDAKVQKIKSDGAIRRLETEKQLAFDTVDQLKIAGISEEKLIKIKEQKKLEIQQEYAKKQFDELTKQLGLTQKQISELLDPDNTQEAANKNTSIFDLLGINLSEEAKVELSKYLKEINAILQAGTPKPKKFDLGREIIKGLGLDPDDPEVKEAFAAFKDVIVQTYQQLVQGIQDQIAAKDEQIDKLSDQIDEVQTELDRELDLQREGYSNNVKAKEEELTKLKQQREQEQKDKEELQKKQTALARAQIIVDTVTQASNLITAATKIFSVFASIPIVGVPLAIAAIGLMLGSFAAAKINAYKAAGQSKNFRHGGGLRLDGPSHEEGGIGLYNEKTGNKIAEYEGNEYLFAINTKSSKKYQPLLEAINKDDLPALNKHMSTILSGTRMPNRAMKETLALQREYEIITMSKPKEQKLSSEELKSMDKSLKDIANNTKQGARVIDMGDHIIEFDGIRKRKIKKRG